MSTIVDDIRRMRTYTVGMSDTELANALRAGGTVVDDMTPTSTAFHHLFLHGFRSSAIVMSRYVSLIAPDERGRVALHVATGCSTKINRDALKVLVARHIDEKKTVNVRDCLGNTPLHYAAHHHAGPDILALLTGAGADLGALDHIGRTPLDVALGRMSRCDTAYDIGPLIPPQDDPPTVFNVSDTPLQLASECYMTDAFDQLADRGAIRDRMEAEMIVHHLIDTFRLSLLRTKRAEAMHIFRRLLEFPGFDFEQGVHYPLASVTCCETRAALVDFVGSLSTPAAEAAIWALSAVAAGTAKYVPIHVECLRGLSVYALPKTNTASRDEGEPRAKRVKRSE